MRKNTIIGKKFNKLTILDSRKKWLDNLRVYCRCDCWNDISCQYQSLKQGMRKSCWRCIRWERFLDKYIIAREKYWDGSFTDMQFMDFKNKFENIYNEKIREYGAKHINIIALDTSKPLFGSNVWFKLRGCVKVIIWDYYYYANKIIYARFLWIHKLTIYYRIRKWDYRDLRKLEAI